MEDYIQWFLAFHALPLHPLPSFHQLAEVEGDLIKKRYIYNAVQLEPNLTQDNAKEFVLLNFNHPKPLDCFP